MTSTALILMYHGFTADSCQEAMAAHHGKHLAMDKFREQMAYLKSHYEVIALECLVECLAEKKPVPSRSIVITIDDGYRSNYSLAFPVLKDLGLPASIFVATDFIDKKDFLWMDRLEYALNKTGKPSVRLILHEQEQVFGLAGDSDKMKAAGVIKPALKKMAPRPREEVLQRLESDLGRKLSFHSPDSDDYLPLEWSQIRDMQASGLIAVGSHTCSHSILTSCGDEDIRRELSASKKRIEEMTQRACSLFSYPNGEAGDFNRHTSAMVRETGYACALTTLVGSNNSGSDRYALKRLNIHNAGSFRGFRRTLSGFWRFLRRFKNANSFRRAH